MTETPPRSDLSSLRLDKSAFASAGRRRWPWWLAAGAAVALVAALALSRSGLRGPEVETVTAPPPARPEGDVLQTATGYVVARRKAAVSTKIPGRLAEIRVEEGSAVKAGEVIARLEAADFEAALRQAEARAVASRSDVAETEAAQSALDLEARRLRVSLEQGLVSRQDRDAAEARAQAGSARIAATRSRAAADAAAVAYARASLENTVVRAPFDGVVLTKDAEVGESVAPAVGGGGTTRGSMVTMADPASLEVEADVGEANIAQLAVGMPAEIVLDAFPQRPYPALLHQIVPTADRQRATVQVKVRFEGSTEGALPEMSAKVNFLRRAPEAGAPLLSIGLPASAVRKTATGWAVFKVDSGVAREVPVTLAQDPSGDRAEIVGGLAGGEEIVLAPPAAVRDGARVRVRGPGARR